MSSVDTRWRSNHELTLLSYKGTLALASLVAHMADSTRLRIYPLGDVVIKVVNKVLYVQRNHFMVARAIIEEHYRTKLQVNEYP